MFSSRFRYQHEEKLKAKHHSLDSLGPGEARDPQPPLQSRICQESSCHLPVKPRHPCHSCHSLSPVTPPKRAPLTNPGTSPAAPERCRALPAPTLAAPAPPRPPQACRALAPSLSPGPAPLAGRAGRTVSGRHSQVQEEPDFLAGAVPAHGGERGMRRGRRNTAGSRECGMPARLGGRCRDGGGARG